MRPETLDGLRFLFCLSICIPYLHCVACSRTQIVLFSLRRERALARMESPVPSEVSTAWGMALAEAQLLTVEAVDGVAIPRRSWTEWLTGGLKTAVEPFSGGVGNAPP